MDKNLEEKIQAATTKYRKAVRREYFRRQGVIKRLLREAGAGDSGPALKPDTNIAGSSGVAQPLPQGSAAPALPASPSASPSRSPQTNLSHKTMPERDDENKAQVDTLRSSSGCDMPTGIEQATKDQATPGQEQKPAMTEMTSNAVRGAQTHK